MGKGRPGKVEKKTDAVIDQSSMIMAGMQPVVPHSKLKSF